ncbi:MAG: IS1634 family transposase [Acidimicrobiia bacterium]
MASIIGKRRGRHTYYYLVESARVDGKPRIVSQEYLGVAEEVIDRLRGTGAGEPDRTRHRRFGDLAAVWGMIEELDVIKIIDQVVGERRSDAAASTGMYLALAVANRVVDPCSKLGFSDWWATTSGERFIRPRLPVAALDHRRFWDAMDAVSHADLIEIERAITTAMIEQFGLEMSGLVLDMTNFATFIDSTNTRAPIAQRGKAKQKRSDLRLIGLSLVVTTDGQIPVVSHAYAGNLPDVTQFSDVLDELLTRWSSLGGEPDSLTVAYDAGQNSKLNHAHVEATGVGFVTSLPPSQHPDLLAIAHSDYTIVDEHRFEGLTAYDTTLDALGVTRRGIVTHSQSFHDAQRRGFEQTLAKARRQLTELQTRLARSATRKTAAGIHTEIDDILKPRWLGRVITVTLTGDAPATRRLTWHVDDEARTRLEDEYFGKRILFTNRNHWTVSDVVASYRSQSDVEASFRQLKDPKVVSFSPMFHWTDQKIRVHTFTCVLALQIAHLMVRRATHAGLDLSVRRLLDTLTGIQETVLIYQGDRGRPRARRIITDLNPTQKRLHGLFNLDRYTPRR